MVLKYRIIIIRICKLEISLFISSYSSYNSDRGMFSEASTIEVVSQPIAVTSVLEHS